MLIIPHFCFFASPYRENLQKNLLIFCDGFCRAAPRAMKKQIMSYKRILLPLELAIGDYIIYHIKRSRRVDFPVCL